MPKNPNLIQFTMTADHREKLASLREGESSIDLVAKRLLISLLDDNPSIPVPELAKIQAQLANYETRLQALENAAIKQHP